MGKQLFEEYINSLVDDDGLFPDDCIVFKTQCPFTGTNCHNYCQLYDRDIKNCTFQAIDVFIKHNEIQSAMELADKIIKMNGFNNPDSS